MPYNALSSAHRKSSQVLGCQVSRGGIQIPAANLMT